MSVTTNIPRFAGGPATRSDGGTAPVRRRSEESAGPTTICITTPYPLAQLSGISRFIDELSRALNANGIQIHVIGPMRADLPLAGTFRSIPLRWAKIRNVELALRTGLSLLGRRLRFDVLHAQQAHLQSAAALLVARIRGVPGLLTLHVRVLRPEGALRRFLLAATEWLSTRLASKVVAVSRSVAEDFRKSSIEVVENGVDTNLFAPSPDLRAALRETLGLGQSPTFLFAGRLSRTKGLDLLLRAATGTILRGQDFQLLILGEPEPDEPGLLESLLPRPYDNRVHVIGRVSKEYMPSYLCAADVFVLPSRIEGLPIAALEALSCGVPLLVSDIRALQDLVRGTGAAWTFRSGDVRDLERALFEIISAGPRPDLRQRAREAAVRRYSIDTMTERYLEHYRELRRRS